MTIDNILAVKQGAQPVSGVQQQIQTNVLKNIMGADGLPNQLLEFMKSSTNDMKSLQAAAQVQIKSGYLDIKV